MRGRAAALGLILLLAMLSPPEAMAGPRIRVEPESFDFGRVLPRKELRKVFRLSNLGDGSLVIERISRSCGCTEAETDRSTLEPGQTTPLRVTVQTRAAPGPVQLEVVVRSNDPDTPTLKLLLHATVVAEGE